MKITLLVCFAFALVMAASGQELTRRERLRKLISAARGGDLEARNTLRNLREKLKRRSQQGVQPHSTQQHQARVSSEPESHPQQEFAPVQQQFEPEAPSRRQRFRPQTQFAEVQQRVGSLHQPHRAINRGLEVDTRSEAHANIRVTNQTKTPPIETIRRYSYFDDEGNYIFGYEAEDGSFKEEKRGKDCIVNGKYGYVDPEGIRREFMYVSGNQCDPNAPQDPELQQPLPLNDQFLIQTQEKPLGDQQISRRPPPKKAPRPIQQRQPAPQRNVIRQQEPQRQPQVVRQPQIQRQPQVVRQPQRGRRVQSRARKPIQIQNVVEEEPIPVEPEVTVDEPIQEPLQEPQLEEVPFTPKESPIPSHFQAPQAQPVLTRRPESNVIFRPDTRPVNHDFNFDKEFKQIFDTFSAQSRPQFRPIQSPPTPAPLPPPRPKPTPAPIPKKQAPKPKVIPTFTPHFSPNKPNTDHHQLVFDAATGTFQTVPIKKGSSFNQVPSLPPPPPPPTNKKVGKALPGLSPLPAVPVGSLSFGNSGSNFDNFFSQF